MNLYLSASLQFSCHQPGGYFLINVLLTKESGGYLIRQIFDEEIFSENKPRGKSKHIQVGYGEIWETQGALRGRGEYFWRRL